MLKITKETQTAQEIKVVLHGQFTREYVLEVEKALSKNGTGGQVTLDLRNVTFVDRTAVEFLCRVDSRKIRIENTPSYVARWIEQEVS